MLSAVLLHCSSLSKGRSLTKSEEKLCKPISGVARGYYMIRTTKSHIFEGKYRGLAPKKACIVM